MSQSHGSTRWEQPAGSGGTPTRVPAYLVSDGAGGVTFSLTGPPRYALIDVEQTGDYFAIDLTPVYLVSDGAGGLTHDQVGPAVRVLADDGAGGILGTTDLTQPPVADLFYDTAGDLRMVRRACNRLSAVQVRGDVLFY